MAEDILANDDPGTAYLTEMFTVLANETVATMLAETDDGLNGSAEWLRGHLGQPYVTEAAVSRTLQLLTRQDGGEAAVEWMDGSMEEQPNMDPALYAPIIQEWGNIDGLEAVGGWLTDQADHPQYDRLVYTYATMVMRTDPERAVEWAKSISDEELRTELLRGGGIFE